MRLRSVLVLLLALAIAGAALYARVRRSEPAAAEPEADAVISSPSETAPAANHVDAPPTAADVQPTLDRIFDRSLGLDADARPAFVIGDFTGDSVSDLAVAVRPRDEGALTRLNAPLPRCRRQDATGPAAARDAVAPIDAGERLLAVVHGVAGSPWNTPDDRPCYLVRHAAGSAMRVRPLGEVPAAVRMQVTRAHVGDVIVEQRGPGRGLVFWTGAAYVWADLPSGDGTR